MKYGWSLMLPTVQVGSKGEFVSEKIGYRIGKWVAKNPSGTVFIIAFLGIAVYSSTNQSPPPPPTKPVAAVLPLPPDPRIEACGPGMDSRRAKAKAAFAKKDYESAFSLMDYCDGRMQKDSADYKNYMQYVLAQGKATDAMNATNLKAAKAQKRKQGVTIGMTQQDVLDSSWGRPEKVNRTTNARGVREQWVYGGGNYLYFDDGVLRSIQN